MTLLAGYLLDRVAPLGYIVWLIYGIPVVVAMLWATTKQLWMISLTCMILLLVEFYSSLSEPESAPFISRAILNRTFGIVTLALVTGVCARLIRITGALRASIESEQLEAERLRTVMDQAGVGVLMADESGVIRMQNDRVNAMFGYESDELLGKSVDTLVPALLRANHALLRVQYMTEPTRWKTAREVKARRKDESEFTADVTLSPMKFQGRTYVIASIQDLTERKHHEEMIARQHRQLKALREIDIAIIGSVDLRLTAQTVLKELVSENEVDAAALLIYNHEDMTLDFLTGVGFRTEALQHTHMRADQGYAGQVALTRKKMFVPDLRQCSGNFIRSHRLGDEGFVSYMAIPLIAKGRVMGVLEFFRRDALDPTREWNGFLEALAGQTAIAIDNAEIYGDLEIANTSLRFAYDQTLEGWAHALDIRDEETEGHSRRVTEMTVKLARLSDIPPDEFVHIRRGALLHDIGKLGIPDAILLKPGALTPEEWVIMKKHPVYAFEWLSPIRYLKPALDIPYCHHEKWDGTGYPRGLKGEVIPLAARLFAIVDVWDALNSDRPYRKAWPKEKVMEHIRSLSGTHFDPAAVELFFKLDL